MSEQTEIIITPSARGYRFELPEWCAPSPNVISGMKVPSLGISYHAPIDGTPYRLFPAEKLHDVLSFLAYWYVVPMPTNPTKNRNGGRVCSVRVGGEPHSDQLKREFTERAKSQMAGLTSKEIEI